MQEVSTTGKTMILPNVLRCPFCNMDMRERSDESSRKHLRRCAMLLNPHTYSTRGKGRPSRGQVLSELDMEEHIPEYHRNCDNCGKHCPGRTACDGWTVQTVDRCDRCGNMPRLIYENRVLMEIKCDHCKLSMRAYSIRNGPEMLVAMWNRKI